MTQPRTNVYQEYKHEEKGFKNKVRFFFFLSLFVLFCFVVVVVVVVVVAVAVVVVVGGGGGRNGCTSHRGLSLPLCLFSVCSVGPGMK